MKIISWNVNGLRAVCKKGFYDFLQKESPDILCIQETKALPEQLSPEEIAPTGYKSDFSSAVKKGYSGVAIYYKEDLDVKIIAKAIGLEKFDSEGRFIIFTAGDYLIYNIYFPSGTTGAERQSFKYEFLDALYDHLDKLPNAQKEKLIICGDYNICHKDIDIHHPRQAEKLELSGFLPAEKAWMDKFAASGLCDSFREIHGSEKKAYSWWSYRAGARGKNLGWRIDYFFVSNALKSKMKSAEILAHYTGSDHCPVMLEI